MCIGTHDYIPVLNTVKAEMIYLQDGQYVENVWHVHSGSAWIPEEMALLADHLIAWWEVCYRPSYVTTYSLRTVRVTNLNTINSSVVERALNPPQFGTRTLDPALPNNVTVAIKWLTELRGRSYRGRTYIPCLTESLVAGNHLSEDGLTLSAFFASSLMDAINVAGRDLCIVSYCNDHTWRTEGVTTPVTAFSVNEVLDSQRRRLPERGR